MERRKATLSVTSQIRGAHQRSCYAAFRLIGNHGRPAPELVASTLPHRIQQPADRQSYDSHEFGTRSVKNLLVAVLAPTRDSLLGIVRLNVTSNDGSEPGSGSSASTSYATREFKLLKGDFGNCIVTTTEEGGSEGGSGNLAWKTGQNSTEELYVHIDPVPSFRPLISDYFDSNNLASCNSIPISWTGGQGTFRVRCALEATTFFHSVSTELPSACWLL